MNKPLSIIALCVMSLLGTVSCQKYSEPVNSMAAPTKPHSVSFVGKINDVTGKTKGLAIVAMPDWRNTPESNIHLFENDVEGNDPSMTIEDGSDYKVAHFSATFGEEYPIDAPVSNVTKAGVAFTYKGIIAPEEDGRYVIPSVQNPDPEVSLIDPNADVLIGFAKGSGVQETSIKLDFIRPVSLFRFALVGLERDDYVTEVDLNATTALTASFTADDVDFVKGTVDFNKTDAPTTIKLKYDNEKVKTIFYAHFVAIPGEANLQSLVVRTAKYVYTYELSGVRLPLSTTFESIAIDMSRAEKVSSTPKTPRALAFTPSSIEHILGNEFTEPVLSGGDTTVTYSADPESVAEVDPSTGKVTFKTTGTVTVTANAAETDDYQAGSASYIISVSEKQSTSGIVLNRATTIEEGATYVIVSNGKALKNNSGTPDAVDVDVAEDFSTVTFAEDDNLTSLIWSTAGQTALSEGTFSFTNEGMSFYRISGSGSSLGIAAAPSSLTKYYVWDYEEEHLTHTSQGGGSTNYYWLYYDGGWKFSYAATIPSTNKTYLYEYIDPRTPQPLEFDEPAPSIDIASQTTYKQEVSGGAGTTVTYSISVTPSDAATIAADGTVTATKKGVATITATAAASDEYQSASASYTLTITNSAVVNKTLYKVAEIESGKQYMIVSNDYAMQNTAGKLSAYQIPPSDSDDEIVIPGDDLDSVLWSVAVNSDTSYGQYLISNGGNSIYVGGSGNSRSLEFGATTSTDAKYFGWSYSDDELTNGGDQVRYLYYSTSGNGFTVNIGSGSTYKAAFYSDSKPKVDRNLAFAQTSVEVAVDGAVTNNLTGHTDGVKYTSTEVTVAEVNETTGQITIIGEGTTVIKAECEEDGTYKAGSAEFTLKVVDPSKTKTYTKVTEFTSGKKYVISYNGTALKNNSGSPVAYSISSSVSGNTLTIPEADAASLEWLATYNTEHTAQGKFTLLNGSHYIWRNTSGDTFTLKTPSSTIDARYVWDLNTSGNELTQKNSSGQYTYYVNYSTGTGWNLHQGGTYNNITVYEEGEGSTPTPPTPGTDVTYTKITSAADLNETDTYIIVNTDGNKAFAGILIQDGSKFLESDVSNAVAVTTIDDVITSNDLAACEFHIKNHPDGGGKYYLKFIQADKYLWIRYNNQNFTAHDDADYSSSISASSGIFTIKRDTYYFRYSSNSGYFYANTSSSEVLIYKKN